MAGADQGSTQLVLENVQQLNDALLFENSRLCSTLEDADLEAPAAYGFTTTAIALIINALKVP